VAREEKGESLWQLGRKDDAVAAWQEAVASNENLVMANNLLAGASASMDRPQDSSAFAEKADSSTPADPLFHWMVGLRLQNKWMNDLAEKHFERAIQLNPEFKRARGLDLMNRR
jgi:tetratricopeptide (TPR) repeat protein